ncbi:hypothetical protein [Limnoglobus roseus]|uniref:Uncharacterized protein n=1 Tax=Limnoglobus roseus TaxID=2598579 RepID=A0A5C1AM11_9BACT|nr:hypothetical protein [Limnoglobus roseus]QEL19227.1 hypothetical protein PX52LOC_06289 [Limnoglobus roseus]
MRTIHTLACVIFHRFHWYTQHTNEWGSFGVVRHEHRCCRKCSRRWGRFRAIEGAAA